MRAWVQIVTKYQPCSYADAGNRIFFRRTSPIFLQSLQQTGGLIELVDQLVQLLGLGVNGVPGALGVVPLGVQVLHVHALLLHPGVVFQIEHPLAVVVVQLRHGVGAQAQQMEGVKGVFQIEVAGSKADSNYQPGQIIEQDPKSGHVRKNNLKITVWICAKEETNLMVNVLGEDVQNAKVELTNLNLNLNVQIREVYSDEYAAGKVISSTPAAGESIKKGDSILLTVSKGPETKPVTVQNYAGLSVDDAALQAENAGLTVGAHQYEYDATVPEGSVIRQSLAPKTEVAPGTEIVFTVSKGPEPSQTTEQTVTFDIPGEYLNPELGILNVEIRQDTTVVYSTTVDTTDPAAARSVSHTFTGDKGTSITVYLYINGTEVASQVVSF